MQRSAGFSGRRRWVSLVGLILAWTSTEVSRPAFGQNEDRLAMSAYEGRYRQSGLESEVRVYARDGQLLAEIPGRPTIRLLHTREHEFRPDSDENVRIVFSVKEGAVVGYAFRRGETTLTAERVTSVRKRGDSRVAPRTLTAADGTEIRAEFGRFIVPENRAKADCNLIELAYVRLKTEATNPRPPLVYLAGGPGGSSTFFADDPQTLDRWVPYLEFCDVVFLDQRGTGKSEPSLRWGSDEPAPKDVFVDREVALRHVVNMSRQAAKHFRTNGIDLDGYTTLESSADLADLSKALGAKKISLLGFSYGTHLALATIKYHADILDNVVICGVEGLDHTYKLPLNMDIQFQKLALLARRDPGVHPHVPDLMALLKRVFEKLEREPMVVTVPDSRTNQVIEVPVGKFGLQLILRFDIGDASDLPVFPKLLHSIDQGDSSVLEWFIRRRYGRVNGVSGMSYVMDAASGASPARLARIDAEAGQSLFGNVMNLPFLAPEVIAAWQGPDLGPDYRSPIVTDVRTLFLTGTLDWNTPPYQAERVRWGFVNSTHLIVENAGHEQILPQPAIQSAVQRFLRGEDVHDVKVALARLRFVPITDFDPDVTHPSADPTQMFLRLASGAKDPDTATTVAHKIMKAAWDDAFRLNNFAWTLATDSRLRGEYHDLALEMAERANALSNRSNWMYVDTLAHVRFARGEVQAAIDLERRAVELAKDDPRAAEAAAALARFESALKREGDR